MCKCPIREAFPVYFSRGLKYLTPHPVCVQCCRLSTAAQALVSVVVVLSGLQAFSVHRSVSAPSWAGLCTEPKRGAVARESHAGTSQCLCPLCPFWCLSVGPRFIQDRNVCHTASQRVRMFRFLLPLSRDSLSWQFPFECGLWARQKDLASATNLSTCSDAAGFMLSQLEEASSEPLDSLLILQWELVYVISNLYLSGKRKCRAFYFTILLISSPNEG